MSFGLRSFYVLLLLLCCVSLLQAQRPMPPFTQFTTRQGLPSTEVYHVLEQNGRLWMATDHGLAVYNGYEFTTISSAQGLPDNTILKLFLDDHNVLWLQTFSGELFTLQQGQIKPYAYNHRILSLTRGSIPQSFCVKADGTVLMSALQPGAFQISPDGRDSLLFAFKKNEPLARLYVHEAISGHFIVSGNWNDENANSASLTIRAREQVTFNLSLPSGVRGRVSACRLNNESILLAVGAQVYSFHNRELKPVFSLTADVIALKADGEGMAWAMTRSGLYHFDPGGMRPPEGPWMANEYLSSACRDREGGWWFTTITGGVYYVSNLRVRYLVPDPQRYKPPFCIGLYGDTLLAGTWNGKIMKVGSWGCQPFYSFTDSAYIRSVSGTVDPPAVYVGRDKAGFIRDGRFTPLGMKRSLSLSGKFLFLPGGGFMNATGTAIYYPQHDSVLTVSLRSKVLCMQPLSDDSILTGTYNGLFVIKPSRLQVSEADTVFRDKRVDAIIRVRDQLVLAVRGYGLYIGYPGHWRVISSREGLVSDILHSLCTYDNNIWCASNQGVSKVELSSQSPLEFSISNAGLAEGLPETGIGDMLILRDTVWLNGSTGIIWFPASEHFRNQVPPLLHLTEVRVNDRIMAEVAIKHLNPDLNNISIRFEGISMRTRGKVLYRCRLISDRDTFVSDTYNRYIDFIALPPGNYTLNVQAFNNSGTPSANTLSVNFNIAAPWWLRPWVWAVMALLLLGCGFMLFRMRVNRIRMREEQKAEFNRQLAGLEMKALRSQMNPHFIFNAINSIQDYVLKKDTPAAQRYLTKFARLVRLILDNSVEGEVLLADELKATELYVEFEQQRFGDKFRFVSDKGPEVEADELLIPSMILQPYLENAIRHGISHSQRPCILRLHLHQDEKFLYIVIEDDGIGRAAAAGWNAEHSAGHTSHGTSITSGRVEAYNQIHHTQITVTTDDLQHPDGSPAGTRVRLQIPIRYR